MLWFLTIEIDVPHDVPQINVTKQTEARMTADVYTTLYIYACCHSFQGRALWIEADMNPLVVSLLLLPFLSWTHCGRFYSLCDKKPKDQSFYNLQTVDLDGSNRTLHHFAGNVTLVVNLATFWGNLKFNTYNEGNLLLDRYHFGKPFVISLYMA